MSESARRVGRKIRAPFNKRAVLAELDKFHAKEKGLDDIVDAAIKFPSKGLFKVESIQQRSEIMALATAVAEIKPKNILEIGTARGGTLLIWSQLASHKVVSCDLEDPDIRLPVYEAFPPPSSQCKVTHLSGDSHSADFKARVEAQFDGELVDFLFIDGDHTEKGVEQDYNDYKHLVRPGGLIAFHDIIEKQALPTNQVYYFWERLKPTVTVEEFINDPNQTGFGIGLVRV
ncbi:class I SAM-dependent methyltransferase [Pseudomonadota bacterium]